MCWSQSAEHWSPARSVIQILLISNVLPISIQYFVVVFELHNALPPKSRCQGFWQWECLTHVDGDHIYCNIKHKFNTTICQKTHILVGTHSIFLDFIKWPLVARRDSLHWKAMNITMLILMFLHINALLRTNGYTYKPRWNICDIGQYLRQDPSDSAIYSILILYMVKFWQGCWLKGYDSTYFVLLQCYTPISASDVAGLVPFMCWWMCWF